MEKRGGEKRRKPYPVIDWSTGLGGNQKPKTQRDVIEAGHAGAFVVDVGPYRGKRRQNQVHETVEVCLIQRQGLDDRLSQKQAQRPPQGGFQLLGQPLARPLMFGPQRHVSGFFPQPAGPGVEYLRDVRLPQVEQPEDLYEPVVNRGRPEDPSPRRPLGDPAPGYDGIHGQPPFGAQVPRVRHNGGCGKDSPMGPNAGPSNGPAM